MLTRQSGRTSTLAHNDEVNSTHLDLRSVLLADCCSCSLVKLQRIYAKFPHMIESCFSSVQFVSSIILVTCLTQMDELIRIYYPSENQVSDMKYQPDFYIQVYILNTISTKLLLSRVTTWFN